VQSTIVLKPRKDIGYEIVNNLIARGIRAQTCFSDAELKNKKLAQEGYAYLNLLHNRNDAVSLRVLLGIDATDKEKGLMKEFGSTVLGLEILS